MKLFRFRSASRPVVAPAIHVDRYKDARQDCLIASAETGAVQPGCTDPSHMLEAMKRADELGLLDPDEPHPYAHALHQQRLTAEFTPQERLFIRTQLRIGT